jgi:hypothetical protein
MDPTERAFPSPEDGNRPSFQYLVFRIPDDRQSPETQRFWHLKRVQVTISYQTRNERCQK